MPPALSDDEASGSEPQLAGSWRKSVSSDGDELVGDAEPAANGGDANGDDDASGPGEGEEEEGDEEEDDEGGDLSEDEFIVEAIKKHMIDEDGSLKFLVKWEGWEKKSDMTWEPETNLVDSAADVIRGYLDKIGGRDKIFEESAKVARGKKRTRTSSGALTKTKRSRKSDPHPADSTPPATSSKWSPPAGSWEDDVESIDACEEESIGKLVVYINWKNGRKTKHDTSVIYNKCPQKMLQFYERHVKIIRDEHKAAA